MHRYAVVALAFSLGFAIGACGDEAATAPATQSATAPEGGRPPVRVVPQLGYPATGLPDPTGRFAVAHEGPWTLTGLRIIDLKQKRLAWVIEEPPLGQYAGFAFSGDGKRLAICSPEGGEILDLASDQTKAAPWLKGLMPIFSPDDKLVYVAASTKQNKNYWFGRYVDSVVAHELSGTIVKTYPLEMNMVGRMSFSKDGQSLIVEGGTGVHLEYRGGGTFTPSSQTIDLKSGESKTEAGATTRDAWRGPQGLGKLNAAKFEDMPKPCTPCAQEFVAAIWDSSTDSLAAIGGRITIGELVGIWRLKGAKYTPLGKNDVFHHVSLLRPAVLVSTHGYDGLSLPKELVGMPVPSGPQGRWVEFLTLVQLPEGTKQPLRIPIARWMNWEPSPDGKYIGIRSAGSVEIWDPASVKLVGAISKPGYQVDWFDWFARGKSLLVQFSDKAGRSWEFFTPEGNSAYPVAHPWTYPAAFSPSGELLALQMEEHPNPPAVSFRMSVRNSRTNKEVATFPGGGGSRFLDDDHLLVASGGSARLLRISDQKELWTGKCASEVHTISWETGWPAVVLHYGEAADILSLKDGQRVGPGDSDRPRWHNPTPISGGKLAVDPLCNSNILMLKETSTGRTIATLAPFTDGEWITYTPDGLWTGSPKALDYVAFYRGTEPLSDKEIAGLHQPEAVKARLVDALK